VSEELLRADSTVRTTISVSTRRGSDIRTIATAAKASNVAINADALSHGLRLDTLPKEVSVDRQ
jgi:hypothetical protein